jgi:signal transduction histidine kinase
MDARHPLSENNLAVEILHGVGHEIRGMVSALSLQLSLIERDPEQATHRGLVTQARAQVDMITCLVQRLLCIPATSQLESAVRIEQVNLARLIYNSCDLIRASVESKGCRLVFCGPDDLQVDCDPTRVRQLLFNLIENAVKFSRKGDIVIRLSKRPRSRAAELRVEDSGPGIPRNSFRTIFEKYSRGSNASSVPGSGLGLHLCAAIVRAHCWKITARNRRGGGAVFTIALQTGKKSPSTLRRTPHRR